MPKYDEIGYWSEVKLDIIRKYVSAYSTIMNKQKSIQSYLYIDAFSGAGVHIKKQTREFITGSPLNALLVSPGFPEYHFIDLKGDKVEELHQIVGERKDVSIYVKVSKYNDQKIEQLLSNAGIVRNRRKIEASINNAKCFLAIQKEFGSFDQYIWGFVHYKPIINRWKKISEIPAKTSLSDQISKDLINRGFRFVGSTIIYAHLQAIGIVNDHIVTCFRYKELCSKYKQSRKE